jgi:hypothetical protein
VLSPLISSWLKDHIPTLDFLFVGLIACACAFWAGRLTSPTRVEVQTQVEWRDRVVEKVVEVKQEAHVERRVELVDRVKKTAPNGATVERERTRVVTGAASATNTHIEQDRQQDRQMTQSVKEVRSSAAAWRIGASAGVRPAPLLHLQLPPLVWGLRVEHRVLGPLWLGGWVELEPGSPTLGLSLAAEF